MYDGTADHDSQIGRSGVGPWMVTRKTGPSLDRGDVTAIAGVSDSALRSRSIFAASAASAGSSCASMSVRSTAGGIRCQTTEPFRRPATKKGHKLIESFVGVRLERPHPHPESSLGRLAQLVRARASHAQQLKGRMSEAVGCLQLL